MKQLTRPDSDHSLAAQGWLELGNHLEANHELEQITAKSRAHPDVLEVRWKIYAAAKKWEVSVTIAEAIVDMAPDRVSGWIFLAMGLHALHRTEEAMEALIDVADEFPDISAVPYEIARYACLAGLMTEARDWLGKALALGDTKEVKLQALREPDFKRLWERIGSL